MRFELIHRHGPELLGRVIPPEKRLQHFTELVRSDGVRKRMISEMLERRRRATEVFGDGYSFEMPISSGAYAGTGQYFVRFRVGTPAQKFLLVADTGSDLTWMNCRYRCRNCTHLARARRRRRVFIADKSSTFSPIECSSATCKTPLPFSLVTCPTPTSPCAYDYRYADGSDAKGIFANESATVTLSGGRKVKLKGIIIGCTSSFVGSSFRVADGVLGLGHSKDSFAVRAADRFGGKFAYCLVDHLSPKNASNYITFGPSPIEPKFVKRHTRLLIDPKLEPLYGVHVTGISVGGILLQIPRVVWSVSDQGGAILDSGSSLTSLAEPAYRAVFMALSAPLRFFERVEMKPFDFCFKTGVGFTEAVVPRLAIHLDGEARFEPPIKSYVIDVADGVKCIGLLSAPWPGISTIGNIMQQNHLWEFDLANRRLGFQPSDCNFH